MAICLLFNIYNSIFQPSWNLIIIFFLKSNETINMYQLILLGI